MQSYDPWRRLPTTHSGRNLAIGGSIAAALIAGVLVCLPILTPSLAIASGAAKMPSFAATISNAMHKGDRLARPVNERHGPRAAAAPAMPKQPTEGSAAAQKAQGGSAQVGAASKRRLPIGCESAFGSLVRAETAARCVTDLAPPTRTAMAEDASSQAVRM
jgi:hypothetical protein